MRICAQDEVNDQEFREDNQSMKKFLPWILLGAVVGGILVWTLKPSPKSVPTVMTAGEVQIIDDQKIKPEDSVQVKIEGTGEIIEVPPVIPRARADTIKEYRCSIQHKNFLIEQLVYAKQLEKIKVIRLRYAGAAQVEVLSSGEPRFTPTRPTMKISYIADASIKTSRKPWLNLVIIAGATTREPYRPILLGGIGFERYLPELMLGVGVVEQNPVIWIGKVWEM